MGRQGQTADGILPEDAAAQVESQISASDSVEPTESIDSGRAARAALAPSRHRVGPRQFLHEVNVEMRKVAWPTRAETLNYSTVVFVTLAILMAMIFGLDLAFSKAASFLFHP